MPQPQSLHTRTSSEGSDDIVTVTPPSTHHTYHDSPQSPSPDEMDVKPSVEMIEVNDLKKELQQGEVDVQGMVDETVRRVREQSDRIQAAAMPYADKTRAFAEHRPVLFTYLAVFVALSFIPICIFVGFVLSSTLFILGMALVGILACVVGVIIIGACVLLPTLFITSLLSMLTLGFLLTLFLAHRLYLHVLAAKRENREDGSTMDYDSLSKGVKRWLEETVDRIPRDFDYSSLGLGKSQGQGQVENIRGRGPRTPTIDPARYHGKNNK